jgi:hypothetical protein
MIATILPHDVNANNQTGAQAATTIAVRVVGSIRAASRSLIYLSVIRCAIIVALRFSTSGRAARGRLYDLRLPAPVTDEDDDEAQALHSS